MDARHVDKQATDMEMDTGNVHLFLLAGKQAVRIDLLESALNASETNVQQLMTANQELHEQTRVLLEQSHARTERHEQLELADGSCQDSNDLQREGESK
jgi:ribonuclease PH